MGIFFVYILKSSVCLTIFYLFYKLLLSRDTFHRFNRIALSIRIFILCLVSVDETRYTEAGGRNPSDSYGPTSRPVQLDANDRNKPEGF